MALPVFGVIAGLLQSVRYFSSVAISRGSTKILQLQIDTRTLCAVTIVLCQVKVGQKKKKKTF